MSLIDLIKKLFSKEKFKNEKIKVDENSTIYFSSTSIDWNNPNEIEDKIDLLRKNIKKMKDENSQ